MRRGKKYTTEEFKELLKELKLSPLAQGEVYTNTDTPTRFICLSCGKEHVRTPKSLINNKIRYCHNCSFNNGGKSKEDIIREWAARENIYLVSMGMDCDHRVLRCPKGHEYTGRVREAYVKQCPICKKAERFFKKIKKSEVKNKVVHYSNERTLEDYDKEINERWNGRFSVIGLRKWKYEAGKPRKSNRLTIRCNNCGHTWITKHSRAINRTGCPHCDKRTASRGEIAVKEMLRHCKEDGVTFEEQYQFDDCKYKHTLSFDFLLHYENRSILVEVDGKQHREATFGEEEFKDCIARDLVKDNFCIENKIWLLRVPYGGAEEKNWRAKLQDKLFHGLSLIHDYYNYEWIPHVLRMQ